jgi:Ca-activated chloride channel family protein
MFQLYWPWLLLALPLPVFVYKFMPAANTSKAALRVPFFNYLGTLKTEQKSRARRIPLYLLIFCWLCLVLAATRPQWLGESTEVPVSGRDLMLAVDVSGSMKAVDMIYQNKVEDRLTTVKRVAGDFIKRRVGDRIGLVLFGTRAYLQAPLSLDRKTVDQLLQESVIGIAGEKTAIGDAIGLALKRLRERPGEEKLLILLTDGANTAGEIDPIQAAELAKLAGLRIHTIGVGGDGQEGIYNASFFRQRSELDEKSLGQIAQITGGQYFRATDSESLGDIYKLIDQLEPVEDKENQFRPIKELFYWPLAIAAILSMLWPGLLVLRAGIWSVDSPTAELASKQG